MLNPMSRMAKMVSVWRRPRAAGEHRPQNEVAAPGARRRGSPTSRGAGRGGSTAPGTHHHHGREITTGERPSVTILVGASAATSQAPAVKPLASARELQAAQPAGIELVAALVAIHTEEPAGSESENGRSGTQSWGSRNMADRRALTAAADPQSGRPRAAPARPRRSAGGSVRQRVSFLGCGQRG